MPPRARSLALALLLAAALAGCDSKADRAEAHYQRAVAYLEAGEPERAAIEFRNVFRLDGSHAAARLGYARLLRDRGDVDRALNQYRFHVDLDRGSVAGHRELAELALAVQDFATAAEAAGRAHALDPADPAIRALKAGLDYRAGDRAAAVAMAEGVLAEAPATAAAHMVLIADRLNADDPAGAVARADAALAALEAAGAAPDEGLHLTRLAALERLGDEAGVGAELERMAGLFPENSGVRTALVQWRLRRGDLDGAEATLREIAARDPGAPGPALAVAQFLLETRGSEAAQAELDRLAAAAADPLPFRRARAGLDFALGAREDAAAALAALIADAPPSDAARDARVELAAMREALGDPEGRDALIAAVLEADPRHVGALKLRARANVAADRPDLAIQDMRTALRDAPRDPEVMTILAMAHEREGARTLVGERLAAAVEVSGRAPAESLRYARFLMLEGRPGPAEGVLVDALRRAPQHPELLAELGRLHAARGDWPRVAQVAGLLRGLGDPAAEAAADGLDLARLAGEGGDGTEALALLRARAEAGDDPAATARLIQAYVAAGDLDAAEAALETARATDPDGRAVRAMAAGLAAARGATDAAEAEYRALIAEAPADAAPHRALVALLAALGRDAEAEAALADGLEATGGDRDLAFLQAGLLEARGDFEGAIAVYETLYARDSGDPVVANNLASLMSAHRDDPESLERAFAVARRLRGSEVPHFQDTYGWILHRRGDSAAALAALEPAAAALADNALVQYHLGEVRFALGRPGEAREAFERALALAGEGPEAGLPQMAAARARIAEIAAAAPPPDAGPEIEVDVETATDG